MTDPQTASIEATKLVKDWSVWMVAVQSALSTYLATSTIVALSHTDRIALGSFVISILAASSVLSGLPYIVLRLPDIKDPNIYFMNLWSAPPLKRILLWHMGTIQHWAFAIGLISLIAGRLFCGNA